MKTTNRSAAFSLGTLVVITIAAWHLPLRAGGQTPVTDFKGRILVGTDSGVPSQVNTFTGLDETKRASLFPYPSVSEGGVRVAVGDVTGDGLSDVIAGSGPGGGHVSVFSDSNHRDVRSFFPYGDGFQGGVYVASGDINGDGLADIITGSGPGGGPHVKLYDGRTGSEIGSFLAFPETFRGGVRVAVGDVDGDGVAEIIVGSGTGGGEIKVFSARNHAEVRSFAPYDRSFTGGVFVAAGDLDGDGVSEIITGNDGGAVSQVKVFGGRSGEWMYTITPFPTAFTGGVRVASGDIDGDGVGDIIASGGPGAGAVKAFSGKSLGEILGLAPYDERYSGGVFVASGDLDGDGRAEVVTGADVGGGSQVKAFDGKTGAAVDSFLATPPSFTGGVRVASGDVDGDGRADIITGSGNGGGHVKVFAGSDGHILASFFPYGASFAGGVHVASGDVNGDGIDDIVTGAGPGGGPHVKVFEGRTGAELGSFFAYPPTFSGGVRVATGDIDGDGRADIVTGSGVGGGHVRVFSGKSGEELRSFFGYGTQYAGGVFVAAGDVNGDGIADIVTGSDAGSGPHVKVFDGRTGGTLHSFFPYPAGFSGGVRVATGDLDGDGRCELLVGPGAGMAARVRVFDGSTLQEAGSLLAYAETDTNGVFIAASSLRRPVLETRFESKSRDLVLRWSPASGSTLETSRDLGDARGWKPAEVRPIQVGNQLEVVIPATLEAQFFRLSRPE